MPETVSRSIGDEYERFGGLVRSRSGLEFPVSRHPELKRAIGAALAHTGLPDIDSLFRHLTDERHGHRDLESFIASLTVGETHFFRNRPQFDALEQHIIPELIARRSDSKRLRIWSAGCASGEEPYSLAIILDRILPRVDEWDVLILATDINRDALNTAKRGVYREWSFRNVSPEIRSAYFRKRGEEFELDPRIRRRVTFDYVNVVKDVYPSLLTNTIAMDLVLCRNVLIYFSESTSRQVAHRLYEAVVDGGWLIVGHAEPSQEIFHQFSPRNFPGTVVYQRSSSATSVPSESRTYRPPTIVKPQPDRKAGPAVRTRSVNRTVHHNPAVSSPEPGRDDPRAAYLRAKAYADRLELDLADQWAEVVLASDPLSAEAHYLRGLIMQERGRLDEAIAAFRRCVFSDPHFVLGHFALAGLLERIDEPGRAHKARQNVSRLLAGRRFDDPVDEGDGLTVGRMLDLIAVHEELSNAASGGSGEDR